MQRAQAKNDEEEDDEDILELKERLARYDINSPQEESGEFPTSVCLYPPLRVFSSG